MAGDPVAEDDDWAPLQSHELTQRPGELCDGDRDPLAGAHVFPMPEDDAPLPEPTVAKTTRASVAPAVQPNGEALARLQELERRCAEAGAGRSLVARFARKRQRQARANRQPAAELAAPQAAPATGAAPTPGSTTATTAASDDVVSVVAEGFGRIGDAAQADPREREGWFMRLPTAEQQRLRRAWCDKRLHAADAGRLDRRLGYRRMVSAWAVFLCVLVLGSGQVWPATIGAAITCGFWWRHTAPDRLLDPIRAAACMFVMATVALFAAGAENPLAPFDLMVLVGLSSLVGFDGELRQSGGFDRIDPDAARRREDATARDQADAGRSS